MKEARRIVDTHFGRGAVSERMNALEDSIVSTIDSARKVPDGYTKLIDCVDELLEVARLRGDDELPHPCDDPKRWTSRMQKAWNELREAAEDARKTT